MLVHHEDAGREGVSWGVELHRTAPDLDLAFIRTVEPGDDVGEGGLAGAVLPQQGVDLAGPGLEIDVVVGDHLGKALDDTVQAHRRGRPGGGLPVRRERLAQDPFGFPITPWTNQSIVRMSFKVSFWPAVPSTAPLWSLLGPVNS